MGGIDINQFDNVLDYDQNVWRCPSQSKNRRLSLAYGQLDGIPREILTQIAHKIQFLDLSHNEFKNVSFLADFSELQTLVLDRNFNLDYSTFPLLKNLEVLWLNNCNLINISDWLQKLQVQCPNLQQLSMMCNPVGQTQLNGVTDYEEFEYRKQVIKILPQLKYFDGLPVTEAQRKNSEESTLSLTLLEDVFRKKLRAFLEFSTRLHRNFKSVEKLNSSILTRTTSFSAKHPPSR